MLVSVSYSIGISRAPVTLPGEGTPNLTKGDVTGIFGRLRNSDYLEVLPCYVAAGLYCLHAQSTRLILSPAHTLYQYIVNYNDVCTSFLPLGMRWR